MNTRKKSNNMLRISLLFLGIAVIFSFGISGVSAAVDSAPVANFTSNTTNSSSHTVQFNDTSKNHPTSWSWDFGDNSTKEVYVADYGNNAVKKIYPNGTTVTIASGFNSLTCVAVDLAGNVYVADSGNNAVKKIYPNGTTVTIASGFYYPMGVAVDLAGNVYVADYGCSLVKKICTDGSIVTLGSGFSTPAGVAVDLAGNVYVADYGHDLVKKICTDGSIVTLGGGFNGPAGVAVDLAGNVYVADYLDSAVKKICTDGSIVPLGSGFTSPMGVAVDSSGNIYVADFGHGLVKKICTDGSIVTLGSGFDYPWAVAIVSVNLENPVHTYAAPGTYTISLTVWNDEGTSTTTRTITVPYPTNVAVNPVTGYAGHNVTITANVTDNQGNAVKDGEVNFIINGKDMGNVTVVNGLAALKYNLPLISGNYNIDANYLGTTNYVASNTVGTLTVNTIDTILTVNNVTGFNNKSMDLTATLKDMDGNLLSGKPITFTVNGVNYTATTNSNGIATISYKPTKTGTYNVTAKFTDGTTYTNSTGNGTLTVKPTANLYIKTKSSNLNPTVGETSTLTYKLGNYGPDAADNVTITFQLPEGLEFVNIHVDNGKCTYNKITRTVTWTLDSVPVGDPYLYLTVKDVGDGTYKITPNITSTTYNLNSGDSGIITINVQPKNNNPTNKNQNTVNAASKITKTVGLQDTGLPLNYLLLAVLMVLGGLVPKRK